MLILINASRPGNYLGLFICCTSSLKWWVISFPGNFEPKKVMPPIISSKMNNSQKLRHHNIKRSISTLSTYENVGCKNGEKFKLDTGMTPLFSSEQFNDPSFKIKRWIVKSCIKWGNPFSLFHVDRKNSTDFNGF